MDTWAERGLITETGKAFLTAVLDPFHDAQLTSLVGWPDVETSPSIVRLVKQSITITKHPSLPAGNWDCMVVLWPWMEEPQDFHKTLARNNNKIIGSDSVQKLGGLQVFQVPSGTDFDLSNNVALVSSGFISLSDDILQGSNRLIGAGFEIHNTTAEIQKQGAICGFMMHNVPRDASAFCTATNVGGTQCITHSFNGTSFRAPPRNTREAMLLPGSVEWSAKDGAYSVARFCGVDNPPYTVDYNLPVIYEFDDIPGIPGTNTSQILFPAAANILGEPAAPAWKSFPVHTSGCIISGQTDTCTFRLNLNAFIESFPGPRDAKDLTIARPSAAFDPKCLEIYSHVLASAPVCVPVGENPLGEWFMDIVSKVGSFLAPMGGIPGTIGSAMNVVGNSMKPFLQTPSGQAPARKRKPQKQKPQVVVQPLVVQGPGQKKPRKKKKPQMSEMERYYSGQGPYGRPMPAVQKR